MAGTASTPLRVLIAGGGVAGLETCLALRNLAGDRVTCSLLTPEPEFVYRPMAVAEPFARGHAQRHALAAIARRIGVELVSGALASVDDDARTAVTAAGERLTYDALVVAIGARTEPAYHRALTWTPEADSEVFGGLLRDLEEGYSKRVSFVIPLAVAWPLPAYELALMTAWEARSMGRDDVEITIYTPEDAPLAVFGTAAIRAVREDLEEVGIRVETATHVVESDNALVAEPGARSLAGTRVVALPRALGWALSGLPHDTRGFIPVDGHGKVSGTAAVWAAGDAIAFPIKQGGLAAQQADAVAETLAEWAGAAIKPRPFQPILRGVLLTGRGKAWLRGPQAADPGEAERRALFWPPTKIAGRYLSPFLAELDEAKALGDTPTPDGQPVELDLERDVPAVADALRAARRA
jgi:sulfide:quinone oxidoreductase